MIFFFQAADGIRDFHVTGVQTCALPISFTTIAALPDHVGETATLKGWLYNKRGSKGLHFLILRDGSGRSEERRVGKRVRIGELRIFGKEKNLQEVNRIMQG